MSSQTDRVHAFTTTDVLALKGRTLGPSAWLPVSQDRVDAFARAADDWHWAHDDVERASRGPFGGTIAHAHLTLSLIPHLFSSLVGFADREDAMFYGSTGSGSPRRSSSGPAFGCASTSWTWSTWEAASS